VKKHVDRGHPCAQLARLETEAAERGMRVAVDRVNGHWRAGLLQANELGESVFVIHATGPDEGTAIRRLAERVDWSGPIE
jgi:hypothetical protein